MQTIYAKSHLSLLRLILALALSTCIGCSLQGKKLMGSALVGQLEVRTIAHPGTYQIDLSFNNPSNTELFDVYLGDDRKVTITDSAGHVYLINKNQSSQPLNFTVAPDSQVNISLILMDQIPASAETMRLQINNMTCPGGGRTPVLQCSTDVTAKQ